MEVKVHHAQGSSTIPGVGCQVANCALAMSIWTLGLSIMQEGQQKYKTQCTKKVCLYTLVAFLTCNNMNLILVYKMCTRSLGWCVICIRGKFSPSRLSHLVLSCGGFLVKKPHNVNKCSFEKSVQISHEVQHVKQYFHSIANP